MMTSSNSSIFSHLSIPVLKDEARGWADGFSDEPIKRIILYQYSRPSKKRAVFKSEIKAVYAIVFEVDADDLRVNMSSEEGARFLEGKLNDKRALFPGERLLHATGEYQTVGDENQRAHFLTAAFESVYKTHPSSDFRKKWVFRVKFNNKPLDPNIRDEGPNIILYHTTEARVQEWANCAQNNQYIDILQLSHILAFDEKCSSMLPSLWQQFKMKRTSENPKMDTFEDKAGSWFTILQLLMKGLDGGINIDEGGIRRSKFRFKTYQFTENNYEQDSNGSYMNLEEVKQFFTRISRVKVPLPELLYPLPNAANEIFTGSSPNEPKHKTLPMTAQHYTDHELLAYEWKKAGHTRLEIAKMLLPNKIEKYKKGEIKKDSVLKAVDRLAEAGKARS